MIPPKLAIAKKTPGLYLMHSPTNSLYLWVDTEGYVQQVNPRNMALDGLLDDEGWSDNEGTQTARIFRLEEIK